MSSSLSGYKGPAGTSSGNNMAGSNLMGDKIPKGYQKGQLSQFTPEQMQLFQQMFSNVSPDSYLSKLAGGDQSMFDEMEAPAMRQFQDLQGQNASRFSGMGMGARHGSGFNNTMNQATSDFAQDLSSRRGELRRQAINDLMGMSNQLLGQRPNEQFLVEKPQKQSSGWGGVAGAGIGALGGFALSGGNPGMALKGGQLGYSVGSAF